MKELTPERYTAKYMDLPAHDGEAARLTEAEPADLLLPGRSPLSHKYSYGRALVIAGSRGFSGAAILAAGACERGGAGLTELMIPDCLYPAAAMRCDGALVTPLPSTEDGRASRSSLTLLRERLKKAKACVVGPGLGVGEDAKALVSALLREAECPLVLDADALTVCAAEPELLSACRSPLLLTPHEGEFKRLGGELSRGRLSGALRFVGAHPEAILILKGYGTLVCRPGEASVNPTGGPAMAKGGSGDVLSGLLCALLAQGFDPWFAARCAVWLHGRAGDLAAAELGEYSLAPSDIIRWLPRAFQSLTRENKPDGGATPPSMK